MSSTHPQVLHFFEVTLLPELLTKSVSAEPAMPSMLMNKTLGSILS